MLLNPGLYRKDETGTFGTDFTTRPEVMAAMFFAAGMSFQRHVDRVNHLMTSRDLQDPLLPGEIPRLLLEDVSDFLPNLSNSASLTSEVQEASQHGVRSLDLSLFVF
jgi:hypothetical protein